MNQKFIYQHTSGVIPIHQSGIHDSGQSLLTTPQGGFVVVDSLILNLWETADQKSLAQVIEDFDIRNYDPQANSDHLRYALACLAEAGLLERKYTQEEGELVSNGIQSEFYPIDKQEDNLVSFTDLVSVIIVTYNSIQWLPVCLESVHNQNYSNLEIIVVDNGSDDGSADWIVQNESDILLLHLGETTSLSRAINTGVHAAHGKFHLLLNPDTVLEENCIQMMVHDINQDPKIAAVSAKLRLLHEPSFLNGLGNFVGAISWGMDCGLGHLDLDQFDSWKYVPSACFAAAMVSVDAWKDVGELDENLLMYYEDTEWCYRARLLGYDVKAAPKAVVYHAYGKSSNLTSDSGHSLSKVKYENVSYGRLFFTTRLLNLPYWFRFIYKYFFEDLSRIIANFFSTNTVRSGYARATVKAWKRFISDFRAIRGKYRRLSGQIKITYDELFSLQTDQPPAQIWKGFPTLTWDAVCNVYGPLLSSGETLQIVEMGGNGSLPEIYPRPLPKRIRLVYKLEGPRSAMELLAKLIQHRLRIP